MNPAATRLYLHVGRNKAGSTTLQAYFLANADALQRAGVQYALFGQPGSPSGLLPSFSDHFQLADFVRACRAPAVLVSCELFFCFSLDMGRAIARDLAELDVQVILYVRPYREWILSSYCFDTRMGVNTRDFDRYLDDARPLISFWPTLQAWGDALGWDRIRVRSLHAGDLVGGDLVTDCLSAIGLPAPVPAARGRANQSPSWMVIEMLRLIDVGRSVHGWLHAGLAVAEALHEATDLVASAFPDAARGRQYLSGDQARELAALYDRDLVALRAATGVSLSPDVDSMFPERHVLPSAACVPREIVDGVRRVALSAAWARLHPELAEFVRSDRFAGLLEDGQPIRKEAAF